MHHTLTAFADPLADVCICHRCVNLQNMNTMMSELAVYASLFLTIFVGGFLGGFFPANSKYIDLRAGFNIGLCIGICCFILNIMSSLTFRGASATLARESDILVFISKTRYWHFTNYLLFMFGTIVSLIATLRAASAYVQNGDYCLAEETGGSLSFLTWWFEWALDDYPIGAGIIHAEGESIKNPWSLKAAELGLARPLKPSRSQIAGMWEASEMASHLQSQDKETFEMYKEFMHDHFDLQGLDCAGHNPDHGLIWSEK